MEIGEDPSLWTWTVVSIKNREEIQKLKIRRLQRVQKIKVRACRHHGFFRSVKCYWKAEDLEELFQEVLQIPSVNRIDGLDCTSLSGIEPHLLAKVFDRLDELKIHHEQEENVFLALAE